MIYYIKHHNKVMITLEKIMNNNLKIIIMNIII